MIEFTFWPTSRKQFNRLSEVLFDLNIEPQVKDTGSGMKIIAEVTPERDDMMTALGVTYTRKVL